jgi:WD40 repeat protein
MAIDANWAYLLTNDRIYKTSFLCDGKADHVPIPAAASDRFIHTFRDGVVAGFNSSPQLLFLSGSLVVKAVSTPYRGIMCMAPMSDRLICGVFGSAVIRMVAPDGHEGQVFVGHCAPVLKIIRLSDSLFASSADDSSIRVWDTRDRFPIVSITSNGVSIVNIAGSRDYLVSALHNKTMSVFDLRMVSGKPVLAVATQDYEPANLFYNQDEDALAMFGIVEKEAAKDSMMFVDNDGQSRQRIFRVYDSFLGLDGP